MGIFGVPGTSAVMAACPSCTFSLLHSLDEIKMYPVNTIFPTCYDRQTRVA